MSCIKAFQIINNCLDEDYSNVISWLNERLAETWEDRGAFPGLGVMLCAIEIPLGILIAKEIKDKIDGTDNELWSYLDSVMLKPKDYLSLELASKISPIVQKTWKDYPKKGKLFLSFFQVFIIHRTGLCSL